MPFRHNIPPVTCVNTADTLYETASLLGSGFKLPVTTA